jgi:histidinol dehydrogenase
VNSESNLVRSLDLRGQIISQAVVDALLPRAEFDIDDALEAIKPLLADVKAHGLLALQAAAQKFDQVDPNPIQVSAQELTTALEELSPKLRAALEVAIERVRAVAHANLPLETSTNVAKNAVIRQRWQPIDAVGLYVPGGKAVYPSSVVMNVVPAQVAGVKQIVLCSPPQKAFGGRPHPVVLAAAALLGIERVFNIGGPAAIAAMAFGIAELGLEPVSLITGPGNAYVAAAKRVVRSRVGIDSEAGPTEIMILADKQANARFIAADLISQAEHDEHAAAVLVTPSATLMAQVQTELTAQVAGSANETRIRAALSARQSAIVLVDDVDAAMTVANCYATEHLELQLADNEAALGQISNAGAIFIGDHSPVSLGDYLAGSNHVLPTSGHAKFSSALGVHTFLRPQQVISYDRDALSEVATSLIALANAEALDAHGEAVAKRFE